MTPFKPTIQPGTPPLTSSKIRIPKYHAMTEDGIPPTNLPPSGKLATAAPDPRNPHLCLVPPQDLHSHPKLRADAAKNPSPNLMLSEGGAYQTVGDMFSDPIYAADSSEKSALVTEGTAPFTQGPVNNVGDLASVPMEPSDLSIDGGAEAGGNPKGLTSNEIPPFGMTAAGPASLLGGVTVGMIINLGSTFCSAFVFGLGITAGSPCYQIASVWLQEQLARRKQLDELCSLEDLIQTGTTAPSTIKSDSARLDPRSTIIMNLHRTRGMKTGRQKVETEQVDFRDAL